MRILLVDCRNPASRADGAAVYVGQLAPALAEDHRVTIVTVSARLIELGSAVGAIRRAMVSAPPEIVHLNNLAGLSLGAVLWAVGDRTPVALSLHDYRLLGVPQRLNRWLAGRVGLVISPSHFTMDAHLHRGFFRHAIQQILPYGIDAAGSPPEVERPPLIVRSTWPEPFPIRIQEAFQSGTIVIASRVGGIPEMIRDGVNGLLVEPGDEAAIAAAVERLRQSPERAARLRAAASETVRLYDMRFHIAHLTDAYRQLLNASRAGDLDRRAA